MAVQTRQTSSPEVFVLYNERQSEIDAVTWRLRELDIPLYYFKEDVPIGGVIQDIEEPRFALASVVLLLLGDAGWGPSQRKLAQRALELKKIIIPALVSPPPKDALRDVSGLLEQRRWIDLSTGQDAIGRLGAAIRDALMKARHESPVRRFDEVINSLVDGNDVQRAALVDNLAQRDFPYRDALASQIRDAIRDEFAPSNETKFAAARRDPKLFPSARGWMMTALICLDPDHPLSKQVILEHLQATYEPERTVRFWTLAGIIQREVSFVAEALDITRSDPAPEVQLLAHIATSPNDSALHHTLAKALHSDSFEEAWSALSALRVTPVLSLAVDIIGQLERRAEGQTLTYDALLALASPNMVRAAQPLLLEAPGIAHLTAVVLREARTSSALARMAFARLLSVFDAQNVAMELQSHVASSDDMKIVHALLEDVAKQRITSDDAPIAGYASDTIDISQDDIGIRRDVETLASVMMAKEVVPPLAIGLFGEWGSGKSFFMRSIASVADGIAERAKLQTESLFCQNIVQIHFNAWHYVDSSLWASLVSHILDELSTHLSPRQDDASIQANLTVELASVKSQVDEAKAASDSATRYLKSLSEELQNTILERERRELTLKDLRAGDLVALLDEDGELEKVVRNAADQAGVPLVMDSVAEFNRVMDESYSVGGRVAAFARSLFKGRSPWLLAGGMILCLVVPNYFGHLLSKTKYADFSGFAEIASRVALAISSVTAIVQAGLRQVNNGLKVLTDAKRKVDKRLANRRATPSDAERKLEAEVAAARANELATLEQVNMASARAKELEDRVALLQQRRSLGYFVNERSQSDDYRRHLGVISVVRKDFDELVKRLRALDVGGNGRVDRIILYIDDVDRCPPNIVVDILQAVHLLLAYELFVVVVSVDPRWLLRSLEVKFSHMDSQGQVSMDGSAARPQDYLEKIFQIPFSVRPMSDVAFGRMMKRLLNPSLPEVTWKPSSVSEEGHAEAVEFLEEYEHPSVSGDGLLAFSKEVPSLRELEELSRSMIISVGESAFAEDLHGFLPTPRSAKRFANVYRLLKASVAQRDLSTFEGAPGVAGEFRLPMLLLAALVGDSVSASVLFPQFLAAAKAGRNDWWMAIDKSDDEGTKKNSLRDQVKAVAEASFFPGSPALVCQWLPTVARYSFLTARLFLGDRDARKSNKKISSPV